MRVKDFKKIRAFFSERVIYWENNYKTHFPNSEDILTIIVKGHLLTEIRLHEIINHHFPNKGSLEEARLTFTQKVCLVKAICNFQLPPELWTFISNLNSLRNDVSHELEPRKLESHLSSMRLLSRRQQKGRKWPGATFESDSDRLSMLISYWLGYLSAVEAYVMKFQEEILPISKMQLPIQLSAKVKDPYTE